MDIPVSTAELARRWGRPYASVTHAVKSGRIPPPTDGKFPLQATLAILHATETNHGKLPKRKRAPEIPDDPPFRPPGRPSEGEREEEAIDAVFMAINDPQQFMRTTSLSEAARVERAAMAIARVQQVERNSREWCTVEDVAQVFDGLTANIRQRILSVAGSVSALVSPKDPAKAERIIGDAINDALEELSSAEIARQAQLLRETRQNDKAKKRSKTAEE
jgi:hypothetical protein